MLVAGLAGCGGQVDEGEYYGVCIDQVTQVRLDDEACDDDGSWYYLPAWYAIPRVGAVTSGGSKVKPAGKIRFGAPKAGRGQVASPGSVRKAPTQRKQTGWGSSGGSSSRRGSTGFSGGGRRR